MNLRRYSKRLVLFVLFRPNSHLRDSILFLDNYTRSIRTNAAAPVDDKTRDG